MRVLLVVLSVLLCGAAFAQPVPPSVVVSGSPIVSASPPDAGAPPSAASSVAAAPSAAVSAVASAAPSAPVPVVVELVPSKVEVDEALAAFKAAKSAVQVPTLFGICSSIALLLNLVIAYVRRRGQLAKRKHVKVFLVLAGALAGGLASIVPGMPIAYALFVAFAPLGSMVIHEFVKPAQ